MVSRASFDAEAIERGLITSDETIVEEIRSNPAFRGNLGSFDQHSVRADYKLERFD